MQGSVTHGWHPHTTLCSAHGPITEDAAAPQHKVSVRSGGGGDVVHFPPALQYFPAAMLTRILPSVFDLHLLPTTTHPQAIFLAQNIQPAAS